MKACHTGGNTVKCMVQVVQVAIPAQKLSNGGSSVKIAIDGLHCLLLPW